MKKRMFMFLMSLCMIFSQKVSAADPTDAEAFVLEEATGEGGMSEYGISGGEDPDLFETEYIVIVPTVSMYSGPGYGYTVLGTLYQGDYIRVTSVNNGWAKFKTGGIWRYVPASAIAVSE